MKYSESEENLIVLDSFGELTAKSKELLNEKGTIDFGQNAQSLIKSMSEGVYNKVKALFSDGEYRRKTLENLEKKGVTCICRGSENYPRRLEDTPEPPKVLYCKGDVSLLSRRAVGVVGSRRTPPNMLRECSEISAEIAKKFVVVTGFADGADSAAAEGALANGGLISVMACGFDHCYPAVNRGLMDKIIAGGLIISEYPPDVPPRKYRFPVRNRIIAALSEGVLIVSAAKKSGALITADYALEYGREVFAFPYGVGVAAGEGCNALIKKGARLVDCAEDIYKALGENFSAEEKSVSLSDDEARALEIIRETGEAFAPDIAAKMGKQPYQIIATLSSLEIKRLAVRLGGNRYAAV